MKLNFAISSVVAIGMLVGCANNQSRRIVHEDSTVDKSRNKDSMAGMNMSTAAGMHSDHNAGMKMDSADETYWSSLPTNQTVIGKQQIVKPSYSDTSFTITANGYISFDARRNRKIAIRVGGRIERLFARYNLQYVHKGEKLLEIYSPELNTYVEEYLYVQRSAGDSTLKKRAKEKLVLLGLSAGEISQIEQRGYASFTMPVYSPYEGYVLFNPSSVSANMAEEATNAFMGSMSDETAPVAIKGSALADNSIREGMYVNKDQTLFWINDFRQVWGIVGFKQGNEKYISKGQVAIVRSELFPEQSFRSVIQFTEPIYQEGQKFTQVRVYIPNSKRYLKQNSLISADVIIHPKSLLLPSSSVVYLGRAAIVWVKTGSSKEGSYIFQSRAVKIGRRSGDKVEILEGLKADEYVAKDAAYLADSETIISY